MQISSKGLLQVPKSNNQWTTLNGTSGQIVTMVLHMKWGPLWRIGGLTNIYFHISVYLRKNECAILCKSSQSSPFSLSPCNVDVALMTWHRGLATRQATVRIVLDTQWSNPYQEANCISRAENYVMKEVNAFLQWIGSCIVIEQTENMLPYYCPSRILRLIWNFLTSSKQNPGHHDLTGVALATYTLSKEQCGEHFQSYCIILYSIWQFNFMVVLVDIHFKSTTQVSYCCKMKQMKY